MFRRLLADLFRRRPDNGGNRRRPRRKPSGKPVTIGFSMPLTGGLAVNGTSGLLAMQIWAEDTNKKGGLLGRPVKLVYYDDQTNPSLVPGIYTKLLDVDKVDLVVSAYGTNVTAPALPVVMQHNMTFMGLFAMDVNEEFRYPKYFSMLPVGPDPWAAISEGFFEIVKANKEKLGLKTIASPSMTARRRATPPTAPGSISGRPDQVVYDRTYPPTTTDFTPIIRAIRREPRCRLRRLLPAGQRRPHSRDARVGLNTKYAVAT